MRTLVLQRNKKQQKTIVLLELRHKYPLRILLEVLELSKSMYYYTVSKIDKDMKNNDIMNTIIDIYYQLKNVTDIAKSL